MAIKSHGMKCAGLGASMEQMRKIHKYIIYVGINNKLNLFNN
jgi:hypothetical protein